MPVSYSPDLRERIIYTYLQGETMRSVAETLKVSLGFVHKVVNLHQRYGQVTDPHATPHRGCHILTAVDKDYIHSLIKA